MQWRDNFRPHAVILTERTRPEPIFVAAIIGAERLLRVDFDFDGERKSYIKKSLEGVERRLAKWNGTIPAFGRPTGLIVNYAPNFPFALTFEEPHTKYSARHIGLVRRICY